MPTCPNRALLEPSSPFRLRHATRVLAAGFLALAVGTSAGCELAPASQAAGAAAPRSVELLVVPEDSTAPLLDAIRNARRRVLVEMYMLTSTDALETLRTARARGVEVRVLLETSPYGDALANQPAFAVLAKAGVDVRWIRRPKGLLHSKLIVVDGAVAYVSTLNLTASGLGLNREYAIVDSDPGDVRRAEAIWNADAIGAEPTASARPTRLLASPLDARERLTAFLEGSSTTIAIEMEELSDGELVARLSAAAARGVGVTVVAPASSRSAATSAALAKLAGAAVRVRVLDRPAVHAKAVVVDGKRAYVGSVNFTRASFDDNREVGILLDDAKVIGRLSAQIAADAAAGVDYP